jgi:leucyl/phenylalanyl-tRNA--protein transferase
MGRPLEPPPTTWELPCDPGELSRRAKGDLVAVGADLEPGTLLAAYRCGLFPMPARRRRMAWFCPDPRGILPLDGLVVSRSLRRSMRRYQVRVDTAFDRVVAACADPSRTGAWIDSSIAAAYGRLHQLGWAHSVEAWTAEGELAGGLYGVCVGRLFAGESMFHWGPDASKVALAALVERLVAAGASLLDVQWVTPHLASLGAVEVPRSTYLELLAKAVADSTGQSVWPRGVS